MKRVYTPLTLLWCFIIILCIACFYLFWRQYVLTHVTKNLQHKLLLLRILSPGRTKEEIIYWMGQPSRTMENVSIGNRKVRLLMIYPSNPRRLNRYEDIWVAIDENGYVIGVYYLDIPKERNLIFKFLKIDPKDFKSTKDK